jgi:hypothetical protein
MSGKLNVKVPMVDYENRTLTQDAVRHAIVSGYAFKGHYVTHAHGAVTSGNGRVRVVIDCSHNPTFNTVASYDGAYKFKFGIDCSQNMEYTLYEGAHIPTMTANKITINNFNRISSETCDVSANVLGQFAVATETSGNAIAGGYILAPAVVGVGHSSSAVSGGTVGEYSFILKPTKKYLLDIQNQTATTSVTQVNFRLVREPNVPTS